MLHSSLIVCTKVASVMKNLPFNLKNLSEFLNSLEMLEIQKMIWQCKSFVGQQRMENHSTRKGEYGILDKGECNLYLESLLWILNDFSGETLHFLESLSQIAFDKRYRPIISVLKFKELYKRGSKFKLDLVLCSIVWWIIRKKKI